jgi:hypothetical protein
MVATRLVLRPALKRDRVGLNDRINLYGMRHAAASLLYSQAREFKLVALSSAHSSGSIAQKNTSHLPSGDDKVGLPTP